uniref:Dihydroneopterin aldolase n=1 Tax=Arundo donax TaxID=35708 RepID=A0A0A8XN09_ARUDO
MLSVSPAVLKSIHASTSTTNFWPRVFSSCFTPWKPWNCKPLSTSLSLSINSLSAITFPAAALVNRLRWELKDAL